MFFTAGGGDDVNAGIRKAQTQRAPDSRGSADHHGSLSFKAENIRRHLISGAK
jgi:hypothetical protein